MIINCPKCKKNLFNTSEENLIACGSKINIICRNCGNTFKAYNSIKLAIKNKIKEDSKNV